jgi:hypothetical protein
MLVADTLKVGEEKFKMTQERKEKNKMKVK